MASTTGKYEWVVIIPDHEGVLDKRMEVRPYVIDSHTYTEAMLIGSRKHFEGLKSGVDSGFWRMGGKFLLVSTFKIDWNVTI